MAYLFFMGGIQLPVTPSSLSIKTPSMNQSVVLANEGEINIPKEAGLREISFEFLLPNQKYPFSNSGSLRAPTIIRLLEDWKKSRIPFRFIVTRTNPRGGKMDHTTIPCLIEDYELNEDADSYGLDVMCSITLKEYKEYGTKVFNGDFIQKIRSAISAYIPSNVITNNVSTLVNVCKQATGTFSKYANFAIENNIVPPSKTLLKLTGTFGSTTISKVTASEILNGLLGSNDGISKYINSQSLKNSPLEVLGVGSSVKVPSELCKNGGSVAKLAGLL